MLLPRRRRKKKNIVPTPRFMAMSKLIGVFIATAIMIIVIYSMIEMHLQNDLSSLTQLLISAFGIAAVYIGFYLTMAKWEHLEYEKTNRQKELLKLKKKIELYNDQEQALEDAEKLQSEIDDLESKACELENEEIDTNC